jgi:hypothetical protein
MDSSHQLTGSWLRIVSVMALLFWAGLACQNDNQAADASVDASDVGAACHFTPFDAGDSRDGFRPYTVVVAPGCLEACVALDPAAGEGICSIHCVNDTQCPPEGAGVARRNTVCAPVIGSVDKVCVFGQGI